ncbi:hypothetical protein [Bacillus horti]|uniref:Amino acid transporter n=1 Tax=Caldalkalibacillus horti TaxID=77523 RepID=A0ABT9W3S5_9BACI|nr:hypothetical protein [Bacillus horti]MDQ0167898.1 hypothetical protein [Bacillus horti]
MVINDKKVKEEEKLSENQAKTNHSMDENHRLDSSSHRVEPYNSAMDHYQRHMGLPSKRVDLRTMPKWLRIFYYGFITVVLIGFIFLLYAVIFK